MEDNKGFNRTESEVSPAKKFFSVVGVVALSLLLALFTAIIINI